MGSNTERVFRAGVAGVVYLAISLSVVLVSAKLLSLTGQNPGTASAIVSEEVVWIDQGTGNQHCPNMALPYHRLSGHCAIPLLLPLFEGTPPAPVVGFDRKIRLPLFASGAPPIRLFRPPIV